MNAPNQPTGGNGRGRQPPAGQPPQRPAAQRPAAPARPPQPAVPNPAALRPQPPQQQPRQPVPGRAPQQTAAPTTHQSRPTPANALPGPGRRPPEQPPAGLRHNGHAGAPQVRPQTPPAPEAPPARPQGQPAAQRPAQAQAQTQAARPAPLPPQAAGQRPPRITVNGAAPGKPAPTVRPGVQTQQQQPQPQPQRPPQPVQPAQAAPPRPQPPATQPPVQPALPPLPPDTGRPALAADDPYPALVATPLDGAPVVDPRPISARSPRAAAQPENVPMPLLRSSRRSRNPFVIVGNLFLTLFFLLAIGGGVAFVIGKQRFELPGPLTEDRIVNVPRGGRGATADLLMREGVIDQPYLFIAGAMMAQHDLKSGEYRFVKGASIRDVVDTMIEGKVVQHAFTVAEGLTSDQIVQRLTENEVLTGNIRDVPREGTLLPETYRFTRGTTREQMIRRMQQDQRRALQEVWERRSPDLPVRTPEQLVTLASIVEKETGKPEERTRVASVFVNRLRQRMKLQSDPTIIYGIVGGKGALGRPIMRSEIEQPTPYNTYVIDGLPPGPIANPGRASLEAAASPARTKELFFVADGTGGHAFSDTYEQHQRNVSRLRAIEQQARGAAQPAAAPRTR